MCISPLHKEILSNNPSLRADAIRLLSSLTMPEISNIFLSTITKIINDRNSQVRRHMAISL
jgi:vesicle coat complex subunit